MKLRVHSLRCRRLIHRSLVMRNPLGMPCSGFEIDAHSPFVIECLYQKRVRSPCLEGDLLHKVGFDHFSYFLTYGKGPLSSHWPTF